LWSHIDGYGFGCIGLTNNDSVTECILAISVTLCLSFSIHAFMLRRDLFESQFGHELTASLDVLEYLQV
jgi:hypothetical protein